MLAHYITRSVRWSTLGLRNQAACMLVCSRAKLALGGGTQAWQLPHGNRPPLPPAPSLPGAPRMQLWDYARKTARGGSDGLRGVRTLNQGLSWAARCRQRCDAAVPQARLLAARRDLGRGTPAFCRPAMAQAQEVLTQGGGDALRAWLELLGEAAPLPDGGGAGTRQGAAT